MILASMIKFDEASLICDLAETYRIYDYRSLPAKLVATLSAGLRDNSRIKMRLSGAPASQDILLLAAIADRVEMFRYGFSDQKNAPPASILEEMYGRTSTNGVRGFDTAEEFEATLARLRGE